MVRARSRAAVEPSVPTTMDTTGSPATSARVSGAAGQTRVADTDSPQGVKPVATIAVSAPAAQRPYTAGRSPHATTPASPSTGFAWTAVTVRTPGIARSSSSAPSGTGGRSEEHTSELQSRQYLVCRLLLEK